MTTIGVIGGGAWGTALAQAYADAGKSVVLWAREAEVVDGINNAHENTIFLKGVKLHPALKATGSLTECADSDIILMVTPAQYLRAGLNAIKGQIDGKPLVLCAKGIEIETGLLPSQIVEQETPRAKVAALTGPTFAAEIARGLPSAVTMAAQTMEDAQYLVKVLGCRNLRPYASDDLIGAQLGGAVKNVLAIACGVVHGKKLGDSARAALLTRGLSEMARLAEAMGAHRTTLMGMCGIGDLMLTASSMQSRNFSLGAALGEGRVLADILAERVAVTEGVHTAKALKLLSGRVGVEMPICDAMHSVLHGGLDINTVITGLLSRPYGMTE